MLFASMNEIGSIPVIQRKLAYLKNIFSEIYPENDFEIFEIYINFKAYLCFKNKNDFCIIVNVNNITMNELKFISLMKTISMHHIHDDKIALIFFNMIMNINACMTENELDKTFLYHRYNIKSLIRFNIDPTIFDELKAFIDKESSTRQYIVRINLDSFTIKDYNPANLALTVSDAAIVQSQTKSFLDRCTAGLTSGFNICCKTISYTAEVVKDYYSGSSKDSK